MNDDFVQMHIPSTTIIRTSILDFLPGQIAAAMIASGQYDLDEKVDRGLLGYRTRLACEAILDELKKSPLWKPAVVIFPKAENTHEQTPPP